MVVNWSDKEVLERLFVATLASIDKVSLYTHDCFIPIPTAH
jgi:hypothetical protein